MDGNRFPLGRQRQFHSLAEVWAAVEDARRDEARVAAEAEQLLRFEADACTPAADPDWDGGFDG